MNLTSNLLQSWMHEALHNRIVVNTKDESVLVHIPAGTLMMGDDLDGDTRKHPVQVAGYWIGIYCVTNAQYAKFVRATGYKLAKHKALCEPKLLLYSDHPVVCIGWADAQAYAQWAGCKLPTEAQWEKAARGPKELIYPWGNTWEYHSCRNRRNGNKETTCQVYAYPQGVSGYGTYNQSGNVWEWCADWYDKDYYSRYGKELVVDPQGPDNGTYRVIRGGSWWYDDPGYFRATNRYWHDPNYRRDSLGFRLVLPCP